VVCSTAPIVRVIGGVDDFLGAMISNLDDILGILFTG